MRLAWFALSTVVVAAGLSGCQSVSDRLGLGPEVAAAPMPGALEPIHAAAFTNDVAVFWVSSNGCTTKEDLWPVVQQQRGDAVITLRRLDEDDCDAPSTDGVELRWSFEELGLEPGSAVTVNNPYQLPPQT